MKRPFSHKNNPSKTLSGELTRGIVLTIILVTLVFGSAIIATIVYMQTQTLNRQAAALSDSVAQILSKPMWDGNQETIDLIANAYLQNKIVVGIQIIDETVGAIYEVFPDNIPTSNLIREEKPIFYNGNHIGTVTLIISTQRLQNVFLQTTIAIFLGTIILVISIMFVSRFLLNHLLTRLLNIVIQGVENIAIGDYTKQLATTGYTDIDSIVHAVNTVAQQISARDAQLQALIINLENSEERYRDLFESANDIIYTHDMQGNITTINHTAERMLGISMEEAKLKNIADFLSQEDMERAKMFITSLVDPNRNTRHIHELTMCTPDGRFVPLEVNASLIKKADNSIEIQGIARDIAARKKAEEQSALYQAELERSNQELQNFAYIASHDLQEPLRKIQTFGDRLQQRAGEQLDVREADYLRRMLSAAERMSTLINDLLSFSRVTSQAKPFESVHLTAVLQDTCNMMEIQIKEQQAHIEIGDLPTIQADRTQMEQLFQNLISNSLKFTKPDGSPHIHIQSEQLADKQIKITMTDNGIGFEDAHTERIFEMFQRLHGRQAYAGTGIGLAICRKIVERHHGTITAASQPNAGATFIIILPTNLK